MTDFIDMNCYKCDSDHNLSIKAKHRDGSAHLVICKPCRNKLAKESPKPKRVRHDQYTTKIDLKKWRKEARVKNLEVMKAYR
jgi:hypothetical protein